MTQTPTSPEALKQAEALVRGHETFCVGHVKVEEPWCSCAPFGSPLCPSCQSLADKIAALLADQATDYALLSDDYTQLGLDVDVLRAKVTALQAELNRLDCKEDTLRELVAKHHARAEALQAEKDERAYDLLACQSVAQELSQYVTGLQARSQALEAHLAGVQTLVGDLLAFAEPEKHGNAIKRNRDEHQFYSGYVASLQRIESHIAALTPPREEPPTP